MTGMIPISGKTAGDILTLLGQVRSNYPALQERADELCKVLGEATAIAGEHLSLVEMLGAELLAAVGQATGRPIETVVSPATVRLAKAALSETVPVLGKVIPLARVPERETAANVEAYTAKMLAEMPPPIAVCMWVDGRKAEPFDTWAKPEVGEVVAFGEIMARVHLVQRLGPDLFEVFAASVEVKP